MNNLGWGLQMTVLGMGIVFALLALLWALLVLVLRFDKEEAPADAAGEVPDGATAAAAESEVAAAAEAVAGGVPQVNGMDADLVAAMMVAVLTHKGVRRHEAAPVMRSYWPGSLLYASRWVASGRARQNRTWNRR